MTAWYLVEAPMDNPTVVVRVLADSSEAAFEKAINIDPILQRYNQQKVPIEVRLQQRLFQYEYERRNA